MAKDLVEYVTRVVRPRFRSLCAMEFSNAEAYRSDHARGGRDELNVGLTSPLRLPRAPEGVTAGVLERARLLAELEAKLSVG